MKAFSAAVALLTTFAPLAVVAAPDFNTDPDGYAMYHRIKPVETSGRYYEQCKAYLGTDKQCTIPVYGRHGYQMKYCRALVKMIDVAKRDPQRFSYYLNQAQSEFNRVCGPGQPDWR